MRNWLKACAGVACALALCACGQANPVIGTGASSVMVTNELSRTITSLEVLAGAPEGFEAVLPTEDVQAIEPGQTVQVNYEEGEAVYDSGADGSSQEGEAADQPIAETEAEVGEAPNAVYLDADGSLTSEGSESGTTSSTTEAKGEEGALAGEASGTDDGSSGTAPVADSATGLESRPIQGDAIRVVADGETIVFDGLDLPACKEVTLHVTDDGVGYVDYVEADDQTGSTKEAATTAAEQWKAAQDAAQKQAEADAAAAAAATAATQDAAEPTTDESGAGAAAGYDEGSTATDDQGDYEGSDNADAGDVAPSYDEPSYDSGDAGGSNGSVNQDEGACIDVPDSEIN